MVDNIVDFLSTFDIEETLTLKSEGKFESIASKDLEYIAHLPGPIFLTAPHSCEFISTGAEGQT